MYVGIGIPIPVLDAGIARKTAVRDRDIETDVIDYAVASQPPAGPGPLQLRAAQIRLGRASAAATSRPRPWSSLHKSSPVALHAEGMDRTRRISPERAGGADSRPRARPDRWP